MRYLHQFPPVVACLLFAVTFPCFADDGLQARSENFLLLGNADERTICEVANQLEEFRATVQSLWSSAPELPFKPMVVFVFRDTRSFEPFAPVRNSAICITSRPGFWCTTSCMERRNASARGSSDISKTPEKTIRESWRASVRRPESRIGKSRKAFPRICDVGSADPRSSNWT